MENNFSVDDYNEFLSSISDILFYSYDEFKALRLNELSKEESFMLGIDIASRFPANVFNVKNLYFRGFNLIEILTEDDIFNIRRESLKTRAGYHRS